MCGHRVGSLRDLPPAKVILFDTTPKQLVDIAGDALPWRYRKALLRFRYGPGTFKIDYALDGPIPWKASEAARAGNLHLGGTYEEIAASESAVWQRRRHPEKPWVIVAQQSVFDDTRAPAGKHTAWAYCHVPARLDGGHDGRDRVADRAVRPGFPRPRARARGVGGRPSWSSYNENYIGGDIAGGLSNLGQFFIRPVKRLNPYTTPNPRMFLCSSSTPPGAGVHGMCGYSRGARGAAPAALSASRRGAPARAARARRRCH